MRFIKQYRMEQKFKEGYCAFLISDSLSTVGHWMFEIQTDETKPSIDTVAEVTSDILCWKFPVLTDEEITKLRVKLQIGDKDLEFDFEKGYSKQRILTEIAQSIFVS